MRDLIGSGARLRARLARAWSGIVDKDRAEMVPEVRKDLMRIVGAFIDYAGGVAPRPMVMRT